MRIARRPDAAGPGDLAYGVPVGPYVGGPPQPSSGTSSEPSAETSSGRGAADRRRGVLPWAASLLATVASAYALDAVATAAGVLLAASGLLAGLPLPALLALLAASYVVWGLGLRVNLVANGDLLERTGASTSILSKAGYEIAARRTTDRRARRTAAAVGYVATELVKEVPYYAGAFGAALLADAVTASHAVVFLAGANLGAAGYEYGLGLATRTALRRRYASFETDWVPGDYLADYYREVEPDELATIAFLVEAVRRAEPARPVLLFGVGPTLHHVFLAAPGASEIHLGDYLPANLDELWRWLEREPGAHDWTPFVRYTLQCEGTPAPDGAAVAAREDLVRARVTRLLEVDGRHPAPAAERYATVVSAYCADSATSDPAAFAVFLGNVLDRVAPGGLFLTAALRDCHGYTVGGRTFPCAGVDEDDVRSVVEGAWGPLDGAVEVRRLADRPDHGYSGIVLCWARRPL